MQCVPSFEKIKSALRWVFSTTTPKAGELVNAVNVYGVNESKRIVYSLSVCFTSRTLDRSKGTSWVRLYKLIKKSRFLLLSDACLLLDLLF